MTASSGQRILGITFFLTLAFCIFEFLGGKWSGSLALVADAGHMLTDLGALGLALFASRMASKQATPRMSYGFYRFEILSALINGAALLTVAIFIVLEALRRLHQAPVIQTHLMLLVAFIGFVFNLASAFVLSRFIHESMNMRAVFFHIISDTLSSVGALAAGLLILKKGWWIADPLASCLIAFLIVASAWRLLQEVVEVLLEATPRHINIVDVERKILSVAGVKGVHDLHVWSISSGKESLSAHLEAESGADPDELLHLVNEVLSKHFHVTHTTLQIESAEKSRKEREHLH